MGIVAGFTAAIFIAAVIAYFILKPDMPWMAFYIICSAGVVVVNSLIVLFFVNKNLK